MQIFRYKNFAIILGVAFALILGEALAYIYLQVFDKSIASNSSEIDKQLEITPPKGVKLPVVHPYWGKANLSGARLVNVFNEARIRQMIVEGGVSPEWLDLSANNHGFFSNSDYPRGRQSEEEYFIAILGGSVANFFSILGEDSLTKALKKDSYFERRKIILLNLAAGGFKQPQQLLILNYFLSIGQEIDLILNIDGFNEAALSLTENMPSDIDVSLPRSYPGPLKTLLAAHSSESVIWQAKKIQLESQLAMLRVKSEGVHFALLLLVKRVQRKNMEQSLNEHMNNVPQYEAALNSGFFYIKPDEQENKKDIQRDIINQWISSSKLINAVSKSNNSTYIHLMQPNQYFSSHEFSIAESKIALTQDSKYRAAIMEMYPIMENRLLIEKGAGLPIFSGLDIFDGALEHVYSDGCCHYTDIGNRIMADFVANLVIQRLNQDATKNY